MSLSISTYPDAIAFPFQRPGGKNQPPLRGKLGQQTGGAVTRDNEDILDAALIRSNQRLVKPPPIELGNASIRRIDGKYIFGGYTTSHFGHYILEACAHLWYAKQRPDLPVIWSRLPALLPYQKGILDVLRIDNKFIKARGPTRVDTLHVPEPGCIIRHKFHEQYADFLGQYQAPARWRRRRGPKVWLSRSALPTKTNTFSSLIETEKVLRKRGWLIYRPEQHSIADQLELLESASHIAGLIGSAFHNIALIKEVNAEITIFCPRTPQIEIFKTIAKTKSLNQKEIFLDFEDIHLPEGRFYNLADPEVVLERLG
ncbi:glycosyltransferase 61 family protein [Acuticoccus sp. I52.16.1]|uniref:glycosyltransferase 61 family protein n=1 Tax=Acuticoccus sp. I52.16.1 TaxID=2928472 RepID=UPI001FD13A3F|nr:glycosyltransferase family 61 protein [Acuticoccus sp. I52.16.1]UOM34524.1 glycosyltransferase family 61 protein [Acuticoccus sp. I52.16.1]